MLRRTPFKSKLPECQPKLRDREPAPLGTLKAIVRGTYARTSTKAAPKTEPKRNRTLLDMARGRRCLLQAVQGCEGASGISTVACHSNLGRHGKAGARRADDHWSVWGCAACHVPWLDQGPASYEEKEARFMAAHLRQVLEWRRIAADHQEPPRFRAAARWALNQLNATPITGQNHVNQQP